MSFEFKTKEERDAWEVFRPVWIRLESICAFTPLTRDMLDAAAIRFDEREATCGIEPLSEEHFALGFVFATQHNGFAKTYSHGLLSSSKMRGLNDVNDGHWFLTDKGRAVLAALNERCGGEK